ncbi:replication protein [Parvo-like hybrid virus UC1]|uniref:Replication-associated protein n=4 Tax=Parvovirus NIH-CQV TaxID=1341019 RepID=R9TFB7_9VIRU|nr:putative replication associated protein [Parvovirus NIH-CQV]AGS49255.1 replication protein [Parvo-like hybrid virus UC1]AGV22425.1 replication protein [Parvo-like hybrid virus UC5]AGV22431.1 replication protein [Parvo-like hybrid virus UC2]AGV22434.1 replication protein [Parvo-like hybrid virus UC3]AJK30615.1 putative replication protein [Parvovirus NIH-CQV-Co]
MATSGTFVPFHHVDREWDARFNVPTQEDLDVIVASVKAEVQAGRFKYVLVSGVEVGSRPFQDDYLIRHVHLALVYNNRVTKSSILKNLGVKQGNGYYLVPRKREFPYSGWKKHHTKTETKVDAASLCLYEYGILPTDRLAAVESAPRSAEEKKRKLDDIIVEMRQLIEEGREEESFRKFPRNHLTYGEKIKAMVMQKRDFFKSKGDPHIWLFGNPGSGKSAILQVIYPEYYNKNVENRFFDRYLDGQHSHVLLQDVDHNVMDNLGVQFFKSVCDEAGYPIDAKYKTPQIARLTILISSNFTIEDVVAEEIKGRRENVTALQRRFWQVNIRDLLPILGVKLLSKYEITQLKKAGNLDPRKIFLAYDYLRDVPTGLPLATAEEYQKIIKDHFYK